MNSVDLNTFYQAIQLDQAGDKAAAHAALNKLRIYYPNDPNLLLWLTFTCTNLSEAKGLLETIILVDPHNPSLEEVRKWVAQQEQKVLERAQEFLAGNKSDTLPASETPVKIPFLFRRRLESELAEGEQVIWAEQPNIKIMLKELLLPRILIFSTIFVLGLAAAVLLGNVLVWLGVGLALALAFLLTFVTPYLLYNQASKTLYVLTTRRLLITSQNWAVLGPNSLASTSETMINNLVWKSFASFDRLNLEKLIVAPRNEEYGDLLFEEKKTGIDGLSTHTLVGCVAIKDPSKLKQMVEQVYSAQTEPDFPINDMIWDSGMNG
jgi:hypothetical protein